MQYRSTTAPRRELRFHPIGKEGCCYAFPCDANGHVDMDDLSDSERIDYLYARAFRGRAFCYPTIEAVES